MALISLYDLWLSLRRPEVFCYSPFTRTWTS
jgi:hypothetical protein